MSRARPALLAALLGALLVAFAGCDEVTEPDGFPCGDFGGRCLIGVEICVQGVDECSTCVAIEAPCAAVDGCACLDGVETGEIDRLCADAPVCAPQGEGLVITCARDGWGCG